jgi:predicted heme/steroid binding protein
MKKFTRDELKNYNGGDGHSYVAYRGKVYDVSESYLWESGQHQDEHEAGSDLTDELDQQAPHDPDMLENFPVVGEMAEE